MSICPKGMWVTEPLALQKLGLSSGEELKKALTMGRFPHVLVERGSNVKTATPPYSQHRFFFITTEGQSAQSNLSLKLIQWIQVCESLGENGGDFSEMDPRHIGLLARYAGKPSIDPNTFSTLVQELKDSQAVILPDALRQLPITDEGGENNGASLDALLSQGGGARPTPGDSHTVSGPVSTPTKPQEGEIYIRADGKKVRRVKKKPAATSSSQSVAGTPSSLSLSSHLGTSPKGPGGDSATVPGDMGKTQQHEEGEIYIRADGKKVRRVKKKKPATTDSASVAPAGASLGSMLDQSSAPKLGNGDSATVPGDMGKTKPGEEGEIYIRADGKKVRRVKKKPLGESASVAPAPTGEEGEVYIRADGKKVRRVKKKQPQTLDGLLGANVIQNKVGSGSATVTGAEGGLQQEGEIYIRADGKKVRRIKKTRSVSGKGLSTFLGNNDAQRPQGGSATVTGDGKELGEIYIRADGKKVRRVKKNPQAATPANSQSLAGFLDTKAGSTGFSGSATVTGAEGHKAKFTEGEIYIRPDGKRVRRIKKTTKSEEDKKEEEETKRQEEEEEEVTKNAEEEEAATITAGEEAKPEETASQPPEASAESQVAEDANEPSASAAGDLAGFLDQSAEQKPKLSGSATVAGDMVAPKPAATPDSASAAGDLAGFLDQAAEQKPKLSGSATVAGDMVAPKPAATPDSASVAGAAGDLAGFLDQAAEQKPKLSGSATVAGDMVAPKPATTPDEEVEIITRPDGTKVRRIRRRVPAGGGDQAKTLDGESATVDGEGEIYIRPDGTKVRRVRRTATPSGNDQEGEIITRPDGTRVRRIIRRASVQASDVAGDLHVDQSKGADSLSGFLGAQEGARGVGGSATVAGDMVEREPLSQILTGGEATASQEQAPLIDSGADQTGAEDVAPFPDGQLPAESQEQADQPVAPTEGLATTPGGEAPTPAAAQEGETSAEGEKNGDGAHAFIVVVGDEGQANGQGKVEAAPEAGMADPLVGPDGEERFAVKVSQGAKSEPQQVQVESDVRYLTLDELANLSGQSKDDLNDVVKQKMNLDKATPRFVLSPLDKQEGEPAAAESAASALPAASPAPPSAAASSRAVPPGAKGTFIQDGMVAVPEDVAEAARAVTAMGASDIEALMAKLNTGDVGDILKKLQEAEKRQAKLEKQLAQAGVAIADDIPYEEAKEKVEEVAKRMNQIGGSDVTHPDKEEQTRLREEYFKLEQEMERYNSALMLTEEYQAEQDRVERKWEDDNLQPNIDALKALRRHMPVNIRNLSEAALTSNPSPNGKFLPKAMAKKFKRTNVLMLIRLDPADIERMHPSTLENMRVTGLTLTERRALYAHLQPIGPKWRKNKAEKMTEKKWTWYQMMKNNFKESLAPYLRHIAQYGPPENHPYATREDPSAGCPMLGKQCPVKADKMSDYSGDYGWTDEAQFESSQVTKSDVDDPGAKAMAEALELAKEKKANERGVALKKHYKGIRFVSQANGSCEQMDETMDKMEAAQAKWVENVLTNDKYSDDDKKKEVASFTDTLNDLKLMVLNLAERSGMQTSGKKKAGGDGPDTRAAVECGLSEEVYECGEVFFKFIKDRMGEMKVKDTRVSKTIEMLEGMLGDLHGKNLGTLKKLGVKRPDRSRKLKKIEDVKEEVQKKLIPAVEEPDEAFGLTEEVATPPPPRGGGGRGGLLDAIGGRGRGGGGRGGLLGAIAGRGKGGRGGGGRGGLMDAISGRGKGGPPGGGRGGLMDAIAGRGRGGGPPGGGRGGLMAAIASRGGGG